MTRETPQASEDRATAVFSTKDVVERAAGSDASARGAAAESVSGEAGPDDSAEPDTEPDTEPGAESDAEPDAEHEAAPKPAANGDARLRDAVAAWVATTDDEPGAGDAAKGSAGEGARGDAPAEGDGSAAEPESESESGKSDSVAGPDSEAKTGAKTAAPAESAPAESGTGAVPAESGATDTADTADAADIAHATDTGADDEPVDDAPKSTGVDQATAVFKALPPEAADKKPGDKPAEKPAAESAADASGKGAPEAADKKPGKAPGKPVDQPTTMLKLGDRTAPKSAPKDPDAPKADTGAKGTAKPEGDAERTSKFVALKPLDEPSGKTAPKASPKASPKAAPEPGTAPAAKPGAKAGPKAGAASAAASAAAPAGPEVPPPVERTTQQPLPPKPPIDLLAELTNTPPPPETPVRTAVRRVKIWTPLVLLLVVVFAVVQAVRPLPTPTLQLTAEESVSFGGGKPSVPWPGDGQAAMDVNGIGTFGTSGEQKPVPIASIAKVMTVYLILRDHPLKKGEDGPKITVDAAAQKHYETGKPANESVVKVTEGQKIPQYEALQAVMLPSANNVAKLLARWDTKSNSEDEFVAKMNKTAKELGMKNTHYTDPSGLDKTTVSTAEDLVKLGRAAMENPVFNEISRQPSYKDLNGDKQNNFFGLVPTVAIGIKTGTTTAAGGNILFAAEKKVDGKTQTIIGAALGQYGKNGVANIDAVTDATKKLIVAGQDALTSKTIVKKGDVVGRVDDGLGGTTPVVATKDVSAVGWSGLTVELHLTDRKGKTVPHTAKAGTQVGVLSVGDGKHDAVEVPVALQKDLSEPGLGAKLTRVG
ncbi:D-alanyl-D-alanine carboxypeptidase [Streptomyces sp. NPDC047123]|uniref:D-alanyl-D-alanine carboxypeptidase n=1 Tax=Streptomyces sp. NPDC047123 TaxID=3155622 RepID=UPI0033E5E3C0